MEELQINIVAFGFPDCGNLRSTKRKDIKMRIKCMQQMLKQRKKDFEFRNGIQEKMSKVNCDEEALQDKMARKEQKILQIDRDRHNLRNQLKEKDEEIRVLKNAQKSNLRDKQANHAQVEQKLVKSEFELKKMKTQVSKLQD